LQEVTGESINLAHGRESEQRAGKPDCQSQFVNLLLKSGNAAEGYLTE